MDDDQQFCLRWNNHQSTLVSVFDTLLEKGIHVDCTLAAEGQTLRAHKVVLCACSPYFENVLSQQYDKHPIIILKDVKYAELRAMMDYMYRGEVNISQDQLAALLKAAESLQIKGLSDNKPARPAPPPASQPPLPPPASLPLTPAAQLPIAALQTTPASQTIEISIDNPEAALSPARRRKKPRRASDPAHPADPAPAAPLTPLAPLAPLSPEPSLKEETTRHSGVEDLTIDEEIDDHHSVQHNDVVRNFQWHLDRSQDELMNSNDGVRDSQEEFVVSSRRLDNAMHQGDTLSPRPSIVTRSRKVTEEKAELEKVTTLAVLRNVMAPLTTAIERLKEKENKKQSLPKAPVVPSPPKVPTPKTSPITKKEHQEKKPQHLFRDKKESRNFPSHLFPATGRRTLPCAQYKTEKGYKCPNCQRCYNARKNLVRHVTLECGRDPQYKCPYCPYSKHRRNELKKHMQRKHPERLPPPSPPSPPSPRPHEDTSDDDRMSI